MVSKKYEIWPWYSTAVAFVEVETQQYIEILKMYISCDRN